MITGQIFYFVPAQRHNPPAQFVKVGNIGRRWVTLHYVDHQLHRDNDVFGRADINTLWLDAKGFNSPGRLWPSKEAYDEHAANGASWQAFRECINRHYTCPPGVTSTKILDAMQVLNLIHTPVGEVTL